MKTVWIRNFVVGLPVLISSCATSPMGRSQLMLNSDSQMSQMGSQSFEELKKKTPIETDPKMNEYVKCVASHITNAAREKLQVDQWEIVVFKDQSANAFALPGGKIGVHTGILSVAKTDAQLAAVLGHEVGHVIAKHGNERVSQGEGTQLALQVADWASGNLSPLKKEALMASLGLGAQYGILLPFSRAQESEADLIGLDLMAEAGFDPRQSVELWKNMSQAGGNKPAQWMSTHPSDETRMGALQDQIPNAMGKYEAARAADRTPHCVLSK